MAASPLRGDACAGRHCPRMTLTCSLAQDAVGPFGTHDARSGNDDCLPSS
jgi:hypothetical protein